MVARDRKIALRNIIKKMWNIICILTKTIINLYREIQEFLLQISLFCTCWMRNSIQEEIEHIVCHFKQRKKMCTKRVYKLYFPCDNTQGSFSIKYIPCPFMVNRNLETPLHLAARNRMDPFDVQLLLNLGADVNARNVYGFTPLHEAIFSRSISIFLVLVDHPKTDLNARSNRGTTPLLQAARDANQFMVFYLLDAGADIQAADDRGMTTLHFAANNNDLNFVRLLIKRGAKKDARNLNGQTPLFIAAGRGNADVVRYLLRVFADRYVRDHSGRMARDWAVSQHQMGIARMIDNEHVPAG